MRKVYLNLTLLIVGLISLFGGGILLPLIYVKAQTVDLGIDTSECYVIEVNPQQIYSVTYSTKSQSGVRMQSVDKSATQRYYYVSAAESPTTISITPGRVNDVNYAIKSITDDSGKSYPSYPRKTSLKTSDLTIGKPIKVNSADFTTIATGKLVVNVTDDASNLVLEYIGSSYSIRFTGEDFVNNKLEVSYDPKTEDSWYLYDADCNRVFFSRLDGVKQDRMMISRPNSNGSYTMFYAFNFKLGAESGTHNVTATANVIPMDVPLKFEFENSTGNETNREYLGEMIQSVKVGNITYTNKEWLDPNLKVPNGSTFFVTIKQQVKNIWEWETCWYNGEKISSPGTMLYVEVDEPNGECVYKLRGKYNSPWRYTLKFNDPDHTKVLWGTGELDIPVGSVSYNGTGGISAPVLKPMGRNSDTEENPVIVTEVEVDGKKIPLDEDGAYIPRKMDEVITISTTPYKRDIPINVFLSPMGYDNYYIILNYHGQARKYVYLNEGWQTVKVNSHDLPFACRSNYPAVYLNGSTTALPIDNGYIQGMDNVTSSTRIKIYPSTPGWRSITTRIESGLACTITADDETVSAGTKSYPQGTVIKFTPTQKTGLVLEDLNGELIQQAGDGSFSVKVDKANEYTLHKKNAEVTVSLPSNRTIRMENVGGPTMQKDLTGASSTFTFPYVMGGTGSYSAKFIDPKNDYKVTAITASPATGFSYNPDTYTATGIKDGMNLTLTLVANDKPYTLTLYIPPVDTENGEFESEDHTINVKYMLGGVETLQKLPRDRVFKMGLSADNFPISVGSFFEFSPGQIGMAPVWGGYKIHLGDEVTYLMQGNSDGEPITIVTPQSVTGGITYTGSEKRNFSIRNPFNVEATYGLYGNTSDNSYVPFGNNMDTQYDAYIHAGEVLTIKINKNADKYKAIFYNDDYDSSNTVEYRADENGYFNIPMTWYPEFTSTFNRIAVILRKIEKPFGFRMESGLPMEQILKVDGETYFPFSMDNMAICDSIQLTQIVTADGKKVVTGVYETTTGKQLAFDASTGMIKGLRELFESSEIDEILLDVHTEDIDRSKTLKVISDGTTFNTYQCILADNSVMKTITKLSGTNNTIEYGSADEPVRLAICNSKFAIGSNKKTFTYGKAYLNGVLIPEITVSGYEYNLVQLPHNMPEGSVVRVFGSASTGNVTYDIADEVKVKVSHDAETLGAVASTYTLAKGTVLKIEPAADNEVEYRVLRNGVRVDNETAANGIAVANATETITVEPDIDVLTFNAGTGTDLSKLSVTDNMENLYTLSGVSAEVSFRGDVTSMKIFNTDPDFYITSVTANPSTIRYDATTGELTNLTTGTLTIASKQLERKQGVDIYVDGSELEGAEITLGNGKVIETGQALTQGSQTIQFAEEDLPIIFKVPDSYFGEGGSVPTDPSNMPTVIVNGETLTYSPEHKGYVFPVEAFTDPSNPPVIKIFPAEPVPSDITFMVEPGVTFKAVVDGDVSQAYTEATTISLLPGTNITLTARPTKSGEEIYLETDGVILQEGAELAYDFTVGNEPRTLEIKRKKVAVTINNEDSWRSIRVSGGGLSYPMYDAASELEFPVGTTQISLRSSSDTQRVVGVTNATTGAQMNFDPITGVVTGVSDKMKLNVEMGDLVRENDLTVYSQEGDKTPTAIIKIAEGKAVEKDMFLLGGYQTMKYDNSDLPIAVKSEQKLAVYLNGELLDYNNGEYEFTDQLPEYPVLKVFSAEQPTVKVRYNVDQAYDVDVTHDRVTPVNTAEPHYVLPGTEITFTVEAATLPARLKAAKAAGNYALVNGETEVSVNGREIPVGEDGLYTYKVTEADAAEGLRFNVKRPDFVDETTGCVYSADRKTLISVPATATGEVRIIEGVINIGEGAFKDCINVTSIVMPESLETIQEGAFSGCTGLTSVFIPNNVNRIEENVFSGCSSLENVVIGASVTSVDKTAFEGCGNLKEVVYPSAVKEQLEDVLPATVVTVAYTATGITVNPETGVITGSTVVTGDDETAETVLVFVPAEAVKEGKFEIPENVTVIGTGAFNGSGITGIVIPETVRIIDEGAFKGVTTLVDVELGHGVREIGENAFEGTSITDVVIPDSVEKIGGGAFRDCESLKTVVVGSGVKEIGEDLFKGSENLTEAIYPVELQQKILPALPEDITKVAYRAGSIEIDPETGIITGKSSDGEGKVLVFVPLHQVENNDGKFIIPDDITEIGSNAFASCENLKEIVIPDNVEKIGEGAFSGCTSLVDVEFGHGVEEIGDNAFQGTSITDIVIPDNVDKIGAGAFSDCENLKTVVVGNGVTEIGENVFTGSENIKEAIYPEPLKETVSGIFPENIIEIAYKAGSLEIDEETGVITGKSSDGEGKVLVFVPMHEVENNDGKFIIPDDITEIGRNAFASCNNLTEITIPEGVEKIGDGAFEGCESLTNVTIGAGVKEIGDNAFKDTSVKEIVLPEGLETIGDGAFSGTDITELVIPDSVTSVGSEVVSGCESLIIVIVGSGVEEIGENLFAGCDNLKETIYPASLKEEIENSIPEDKKETIVEVPYTADSIERDPETGVIIGKTTPAEGSDQEESKVLVFVPAIAIDENGTFNVPDGVDVISAGAFATCDNLTGIIIPDSVEKIGDGAFEGCENLTNVTIGAGVKEIGDNAFKDTSVKEIVLPEGLETIGDGAFSGTDITELVIPDSVTSVGSEVVSGCENLTTVIVGSGVEEIGENLFAGCDNLKETIYPASLKEEIEKSIPEDKKETIVEVPYTADSIERDPETGVIIGKTTPAEGSDQEGSKILVFVPETAIDENGTFNVPEDIDEIGAGAFSGCDNLITITIPEGVEKIGEGAFEGCDKLTEVELPEGLKEIGDDAFKGTGITNIEIPETVTTIGDGAFSDCENLEKLDIPDTVENLGEGVLSGCENLASVSIPEGVEEIGADEFKGCTSLTEVSIPESVTSIGSGAFEGCTNLETITVPEGVTSIGENSFKGCENLSEIELPETVTELGNGAFEDCKSLVTVTIPESVETIGDNTFKGCESLVAVDLPDALTSIGDSAFEDCKNLEVVEIPMNVTEIGENTFKGCESLTTVAIPPTMETIGAGAFEGCTGLDKCVYPDTFDEPFGEGVGISYPADEAQVSENGVIFTPDAIYFVPADVKAVTVPETVSVIEDKAFKGCTEITEITLPETVTTIGMESFKDCDSLEAISIPNQVTSIEEGAFSGCSSLTEVNIGSSVTEIGKDAFSGCSSLREIDIHSNVKTIGVAAFSGSGLTEIHLGAGITHIADYAFSSNNISTIAITAQEPPTLGEDALGDSGGAALLVQGSKAKAAYALASGWSHFSPEEMVVATRIDTSGMVDIDFEPGMSIQLQATVYPSNAKLGKIFWESEDPSFATVDHNGLLKIRSTEARARVEVRAAETETTVRIIGRTMYDNGPTCVFRINNFATGLELVVVDGEGDFSLSSLLGKARIFTLSGVELKSDTKNFEPGIYIVKMDGRTFKVMVRE